jgi:hypothetical protein
MAKDSLGGPVRGEPQHLVPPIRQPTGAGDQHEAQNPHALQDIAVRPLARAAAERGSGVELEAVPRCRPGC